MDIGEDYSHLYAGEIKKRKKKVYTDGLKAITQKKDIDVIRAQIRKSRHNISALLLRGERTSFFVTEDSGKYITPFTQKQYVQNYERINAIMRFDSVHIRYQKKYTVGEIRIKRFSIYTENLSDAVANYRAALRITISPMRMYQVSLGGAMIFGMVSMSMIYQNLGPSAFAEGLENVINKNDDTKEIVRVIENESDEHAVAQEEKNDAEKQEGKEKIQENENTVESDKEKNDEDEQIKNEDANAQKSSPVIMTDVVPKNTQMHESKDQGLKEVEKKIVQKSVDSVVKKEELPDDQEIKNKTLEELAYETVKDYPIEKMLPYILEQDPEVAKYLIAIAKQESQWGKRVPVLNGQDCYNYWGYRGQRKLMGTGGHTCFNSRKDAVETVAKRLHTLIYENDRKTANKLIVWKCGSSCAGHSQDGVDRWINVVDTYHDKLSGNSL